ncbi:MAG TPA: 16S rRNA (cytosine(1402)-N(4))-methyltransferase RsmH [Rickettsiales bacterium]|nr:16S rRNA (cytosine(1402)-N(4))-methyltransferase RsmH [Rickettsiales bacterium]
MNDDKTTQAEKAPHTSVMLNEVLEAMQPADGEIYVDGTFGAGGYSRALLESSRCTVYAIDRDPNVSVMAEKLSKAFPGRFFWLMGNFSDMVNLLAQQGVTSVNGIVLDIGVSSMQLDNAERGFSFKHDGPLDMRMSGSGQSAFDIVNSADEKELADILYYYGEERKSRQIARAIVNARTEAPIARTRQLAEIIRRVLGSKDGLDPSTRTFQALRIKVNDELGELEQALSAAENLLAEGGRLVVVTFHSLEDRIVKQFFQSRSGETRGGSRHLPQIGATHKAAADHLPVFFLNRRKPVLPGTSELRSNPRARSAKLRVAIRSGYGK